MCRLLGISMGDTAEDVDAGQIAALMFKVLTPGGPHAYGFMDYVDGADSVMYQSRPGRADSLDNLEHIYSTVQQRSRWFVGHTRWATHGDPKNTANNHPILHGNILGVHNGVLQNHQTILAETGRQDPTAEVDSEAIFAAVNKWGALPGIRKVEGDMVAIWNDLNDMETLHIARSEGRFLTLAWTDRGNLIFASQPGAIEALHPLVRITKWSTVDQQKLLTIKAGKIVKRERIRKPSPKKAVVAVTGKNAATDRFVKEFFDAKGVAQQKRGSRRGEAMFPKPVANVHDILNPPTAPKKPAKKKAPKVDETVTERWVADMGMFEGKDGTLRPATQEEAEFFGWDSEADLRLFDSLSAAEQEKIIADVEAIERLADTPEAS